MESFERNINASISRLNSDTISTKASLLDLNHNMRVELKIDLNSKKILEADAQIVRAPFKICRSTVHLIKNIVGLMVERGIARKLSRILGGNSGCTHLFELTMEAIRFSSNILLGFGSVGTDEWIDREESDEEFIRKSKPYLKNMCLPFKEGK